MDDFLKAILRLSKKEQDFWLSVIRALGRGDITFLDIKKLSGFKTLYRVRKGDLRLVFRVIEDKNVPLRFGARGDVYKFLK